MVLELCKEEGEEGSSLRRFADGGGHVSCASAGWSDDDRVRVVIAVAVLVAVAPVIGIETESAALMRVCATASSDDGSVAVQSSWW